MENQSKLLKEVHHNKLLKLLLRFEEFFGDTLVTSKTDAAEFEFKDNVKQICSKP